MSELEITVFSIYVMLELSCFSHVRPFATPWTVACQAPLSMGFSRQEYCSGLPFPPPCYAQLCLTLCNPMDCKPPGSSFHGTLQARVLEWIAMPSSRGSAWPRDGPRSLTSPCWQADSWPLVPPGKHVQA